MAFVTGTIGAPTATSATRLQWGDVGTARLVVPPALQSEAGAAEVRLVQLDTFAFANFRTSTVNLTTAAPNTPRGGGTIFGPDLSDAWEKYNPAFILEVATLRLALPGPNAPGVPGFDTLEPYRWNWNDLPRYNQFVAFITAFRALPSATQAQTKLTLADGPVDSFIARAGVPTVRILAAPGIPPIRMRAEGWKRAVGAPGTTDPEDITFDAAGRLYQTDSDTRLIYRKTGGIDTGYWVDSIAGPDSAPYLEGITFDPDGNLYTTDSLTQRIYRRPGGYGGSSWDAGILPARTARFPVVPVEDIDFDAAGDLFTLNNLENLIHRRRGGWSGVSWDSSMPGPAGVSNPSSIAFGPAPAEDAAQPVYMLTRAGVIYRRATGYEANGNASAWERFLEAPTVSDDYVSIAIDPDGGLYLLDHGNRILQRSGPYLTVTGVAGAFPGEMRAGTPTATLVGVGGIPPIEWRAGRPRVRISLGAVVEFRAGVPHATIDGLAGAKVEARAGAPRAEFGGASWMFRAGAPRVTIHGLTGARASFRAGFPRVEIFDKPVIFIQAGKPGFLVHGLTGAKVEARAGLPRAEIGGAIARLRAGAPRVEIHALTGAKFEARAGSPELYFVSGLRPPLQMSDIFVDPDEEFAFVEFDTIDEDARFEIEYEFSIDGGPWKKVP